MTRRKICKVIAIIGVLVLGLWIYRVSEYEKRDMAHGQCEMEARRLYLKEQEDYDEDKSTDDALNRNFAAYMDACMSANGYYRIIPGRGEELYDVCGIKSQQEHPTVDELFFYAELAACYAPSDLLRRLMISFSLLF